MNHFWERVKELQKRSGYFQEDLASIAGVSIGVYKNWIYRDIIPRADEACKIAEALNTTVEYLVTGKGVYITAEQLLDLEKEVNEKFSELTGKLYKINNLGKEPK